ncbi:hypothetical protein MTHERMOG20_16480 [Moorella thermoacetica]|nr:hypothetical protein [Moorella thermoacetica]APC09475.1 hypothetical protein MTJW_23260 [Moorella thermoacetica]GAF25486.1 hypothetical protein MTY_0821 [Moorella thermoacetica Y72]GLI17194.1 hypothetical protein MTHERMOG20_16480 [Moorella thermoacetica]
MTSPGAVSYTKGKVTAFLLGVQEMIYGIVILGGAVLALGYYLYRQQKDPGYSIFPHNQQLK